MPANPAAFDSHLPAWDAYLTTPWARVRYDVVADVLDETLAQLGSGPLRVLDLGGGDGLDSVRLAAMGHQITIVDQAPGMLERARASARRGGCIDQLRTVQSDLLTWRPDQQYDLALCHFVLPYLDLDDERQVWPLLREVVRPGGTASVVSLNPVSEVLSAVYRDGDVRLALRRFDGEPRRTGTFSRQLRSRPRCDVELAAADAGFEVARRIGIRVAVDLLPEDPIKYDPQTYPAILELELALAQHQAYLDAARACQLLMR